MQRIAPILLAIVVCAGFATAGHADATTALDDFIAAWNSGDAERFRGEIHFPLLTLFDAFELSDDPSEFHLPKDQLEAEGWVRSGFEDVEVIARFDSQVHFRTAFSRYNASGHAYRSGRVYYIVTERDGAWHIQARMFIGVDREADDAPLRAAIDRYFVAWNAADNVAQREEVHFPHAFLVGDRVGFSKNPEELETNFQRMREEEGWERSTYSSFSVLHRDDARAVVALTFHRHDAEGTVYRSVPVVWVLTQRDGHWAVQLRAIP